MTAIRCIRFVSVLGVVWLSTSLSGCERIGFFIEAARLRALTDTTQSDTTTTDVRATQDALGRPAVLLSAFFGLDDALPAVAERIFCDGAGGIDGMPVVFSHEVDLATLQAGDFKVVSASGVIGPVLCVTPAPANDIGEARTILLIGQYGSAEDAPAQVEIVGNLLSKDGQLNFRGAKTEVIPLEDGPTLVWAEVVPEAEWTLGDGGTAFPGGGGDSCPIGTKQVVRATWAGGVSKPGGAAIDDAERAAYRVTVRVGEEESDVVPFALADLNDGDNNHELCLDRGGEPLRVSFPAGLMSDPRDDLNPATRVAVTGAS